MTWIACVRDRALQTRTWKSAVALKELNNRTDIDDDESFTVGLFKSIQGVLHVVRNNYCTSQLDRVLPSPYNRFYIHTMYKEYLLNN